MNIDTITEELINNDRYRVMYITLPEDRRFRYSVNTQEKVIQFFNIDLSNIPIPVHLEQIARQYRGKDR